MALSTRPVTQEERAGAPAIVFNEIPLGAQAVALAVSRDVWNGGVHSLSADQVRNIYEGKIKNWKEVGGPDQKISIFLPGRGMFEMFAQWLYGEAKKAPGRNYPTITAYDEIHTAIEFTPGGFSQIPVPCVDGKVIHALAIKDENGELVEATRDNFVSGRYPLCRKLLMVIDGQPTRNVRVLVDFMLGERGQKIVKDASILPIRDVTPD